jgi:hypothetical protein
MKMLVRFALLLVCVAAHGQAMFFGLLGSAALPTLSISCFAYGSTSPYTTSSINTTGAKAIIAVTSQTQSSITVEDLLTSTNFTAAGTSTDFASIVGIYHELLPSSTGTGATFKISASGNPNMYGNICILPIFGGSGVYDSNYAGSYSSSTGTCSPGSINPGAGVHVVITGYSSNDTASTPSATLTGGYTITGGQKGNGNYAIGTGYLVQNPGASTNPQWADSSASASACGIASYH